MKLTFLIDNRCDNPELEAEHGLSVLIETDSVKILFDGGASDKFLKNAEKMGINLSDVDYAVISHGHFDHTGGIPAFCGINSKAVILLHKNALRTSSDGIHWTKDELEAIRPRIRFTEGPEKLAENIYLTGTVPVGEDFKPTEKFCYREITKEGNTGIYEDDMSHEQCLVIKEDTGLYVFSGCSHRGVINGLNACKKLFPGEKVKLMMAGMHLYSTTPEKRIEVVNSVSAEDIDIIIPVHCTGKDGICMFEEILGSRCAAAKTGDVLNF